MTPEQQDRAVAHVERWAYLWWNPTQAWAKREGGEVVVTLRRRHGEATVTIATDDRHAIFKGLSRHGRRLYRRCDGLGVPIEGRAGDGRWRREVA